MKSFLPVALSLLAMSPMVVNAQELNPSVAAANQNLAPSKLVSPMKAVSPAITAAYGKLPLSFEANQGQSDPQVKFLSRGQGYSLFLTDTSAVLSLSKGIPSQPKTSAMAGNAAHQRPAKIKTDVVRMELAGAARGMQVSGADPLPGKANYLLGKDSSQWHSNVPTYAKVKYSNVYPGIDLVYYGNQRQLEYDFVVAPNADPNQARLHFAGAGKLKLNSGGDLEIIVEDGEIAFHKPVIYQMKDGERQPVEGSFQLMAKNSVGFRLASYDHSRELVVDPILAYSTYLGGTGNPNLAYDSVAGVGVDAAGNAYIAGYTISTDFPVTTGAISSNPDHHSSAPRGYVTEFDPTLSTLVYSTYFGGDQTHPGGGDTYPAALFVDGSGAVYLTGMTYNSHFPATRGPFGVINSQENAFVTKLAPGGSALVYSFLIASSLPGPTAITVDRYGSAYLTGGVNAFYDPQANGTYPTPPGAYQASSTATVDTGYAFVTKINPEGTAFDYSTYLGGPSIPDILPPPETTGLAIAVNDAGEAYVAGRTGFVSFPTTPGAFQSVNKTTATSGGSNGFIAKLNAAGSGLIYSTYLGGASSAGPYYGDEITSIALDHEGEAYVAGQASSLDFPTTAGAYQRDTSGPQFYAGFISKMNPTGTALVYSTYLGGTTIQDVAPQQGTTIAGLAIDESKHVFITGATSSNNFPVTPDAFQRTTNVLPGSWDANNAFFAELNATGSSLLYSTYLGGHPPPQDVPSGDAAAGIALDGSGHAFIVGLASSVDFPVTSKAHQQENNAGETLHYAGQVNDFVTRFDLGAMPAASATLTGVYVDDGSFQYEGGLPLTFTAVVRPYDGYSIPTGTVDFMVDGVMVKSVPLGFGGFAVYNENDLSLVTHIVTARYEGSALNDPSTSDLTTVSVDGGAAPPTYPQPGGTYNRPVKVAIESATSEATIHYTTDGTFPTVASAKYVGPITISATRTVHAIAVKSGFTSASTAAIYTIVPSAIPTKTAITSDVNPSAFNERVTFTARVTASSGATPTGTVMFKDGSQLLGTAPLVKGVAKFTIPTSLTLYGHTISALYTGSATNVESGASLTQVVVP
ncbi:Cell surface protein (plasmid) [Acidisarcina polymorpha]|uniref:Cell surface protein n=1 Tax=Acidisarcina polymorpha TaxID=2211140 RepID=A0A2Z5GAV8_9BACT|nr:SBBP repeat-containing protein [Acidisarcina polymorpha]AXC16050.1 Cell surface protein [Acidisarcina polymorpha]